MVDLGIYSTLDDDSIPEQVVTISSCERVNPARLDVAIDVT
jgi:hypothetical protein